MAGEATRREWRGWIAGAVVSVLMLAGVRLFVAGSGPDVTDSLGWLLANPEGGEWIAEAGAVRVGAIGILGALVILVAVVHLGALLGRRSGRRDGDGLPLVLPRPHRFVWWGAAALTGAGLMLAYIGLRTPQPTIYFAPIVGPLPVAPNVIDDPALLFEGIYVTPETAIGYALTVVGLAVLASLLARAAVGRGATAPTLVA